ncbi:MAG TPA: hypothetical protein ENK59_07340 [Thioploca sp.]|nr:hypothetical protein [Thioploca sp.]
MYARVSSSDQNIDRQLRVIEAVTQQEFTVSKTEAQSHIAYII